MRRYSYVENTMRIALAQKKLVDQSKCRVAWDVAYGCEVTRSPTRCLDCVGVSTIADVCGAGKVERGGVTR